MCDDSLWCILQPSKVYQTVSSSILLCLCWDHVLIHFWVSHNPVRCSKQSVVVNFPLMTSHSQLLCIVTPSDMLWILIGECNQFLFYMWMLCNSLWGVSQPSKMPWTVSQCIQAVPGLLPDLLWGVSQPSEVLWIVSCCSLLTVPLDLSLPTTSLCSWQCLLIHFGASCNLARCTKMF